MPKHSKRAIEKLSETAFLLNDEDVQSADSIAFIHSVLSQIGLPRRRTSARVWERSNGGAHLAMIAGGILDEAGNRVELPLPQGPYARLILADISTYAVRHKTHVVPLESSVSAYMRCRLKLFVTGGARGTLTSFKREAQALASAHMELSVRRGSTLLRSNAPPIDGFEAWTVDEGGQQALWPAEIELNRKFFESLKMHAAPIDMRAYRALAHSALAQDIYTWLAHRLPRLDRGLNLPWAGAFGLAAQFGGYSDPARFRKEFVKRLAEVRTVYPGARVEVIRGQRGERGGSLRIEPSSPPVYRAASVLPGAIGARAEMSED